MHFAALTFLSIMGACAAYLCVKLMGLLSHRSLKVINVCVLSK